MAKNQWGDEAGGGDDDGDSAGLTMKKVQIENAYFERLRERLSQHPAFAEEQATGEAEKPAGPVVYNDDGSVYRRPE